jgi:hypothetical protein
MEQFPEYFAEYKRQMAKGDIQKAYRGLMEFILSLRSYFANNYPAYDVSGSIYHGYMDMTYFSFIPPELKLRKLKVAIVFVHENCRFEAWLAGYNKHIQARYWKEFKDRGWDKYSLVPALQGRDAIIEHTLVGDPDFRDLAGLTQEIEHEVLKFIEEIKCFLTANQL